MLDTRLTHRHREYYLNFLGSSTRYRRNFQRLCTVTTVETTAPMKQDQIQRDGSLIVFGQPKKRRSPQWSTT